MIDSKDLPRYVGEEYILQFIRWMTPYPRGRFHPGVGTLPGG